MAGRVVLSKANLKALGREKQDTSPGLSRRYPHEALYPRKNSPYPYNARHTGHENNRGLYPR